MNTRYTRVLLLAAIVAAPTAAGAQQQQRSDRINLEMYLDWETVGDPQISPDGSQIIYARRWVDKINDARESSLWIMNVDGSKNRFLTNGSSPRWSPDGTRISFTRTGQPRGTQIFVRWMDAEGAETQITRLDDSPGDVSWSPDGKSMAFTMNVEEREPWTIRLPARPEGARWTADPKVVTRLQYRRDGTGFVDDAWRHIFVVPAEGGTPRQLTSGNWNHGGVEWTPDGRSILFGGLRVENPENQWRESEIYAVDVASGNIRQLTTRKGQDGSPSVSPDGKFVAYTGNDWSTDTYTASKLYLMNMDGSNPRMILGDLDRSPEGISWAPDNSGVYFIAQDRGTSNLYFAGVTGGVRKLTNGNHILGVSSMTAKGLAVGTLSDPTHPGDIVTFDLKKPEFKQLTDVNADVLVGKKIGQVEEIWYTSVDNYKIQGWIIKPPDFDPRRKYPLMLSIHGGPHSMYGVGFNFAWQEHAANDYVILYTNPRGSTGYGSAFGNAIKYAYPSKDFNDLMAGVDSVIGRGYIDTRNLFVYGCSGGGVLTSWIVGHTDRFAAAGVLCPVTNWLSFVGTTDGAGWYRNFAKLPWEDPTEHLQRSPLMYVGNVKTPTFLMTGVNDLRTPMGQTEEFYQALRLRGIPTAMVRMNGEFHGTSSKPSNFLRTQLFLRDWFQKYTTKDRVQATGQN